MDSTVTCAPLEILGLVSDPGEEWRRLLSFVQLGDNDKGAMSGTVSILLERAQELVVNTYEYLQSVPETAAILGWEHRVDKAHLEERRRFFTIWVARTLGMDTSDEFAHYLFRAGKFHAGHGPRRIHTPPEYVTGSIGLVQASFATYMAEAKLEGDIIARALAGWGKYLSAQLHMMLIGYQVAREYSWGKDVVVVKLYGRMRTTIGARETKAGVAEGDTLHDVLRRFFSYHPLARSEALERVWHTDEEHDVVWTSVYPAYVPKGGWRVLVNGRNVAYDGGFSMPICAKDEIGIFPPGR